MSIDVRVRLQFVQRFIWLGRSVLASSGSFGLAVGGLTAAVICYL